MIFFNKKPVIVGIAFIGLMAAPIVYAQEGSPINVDDLVGQRVQDEKKQKEVQKDEIEQSIDIAIAELNDEKTLAQKLELAKKIHQIRPTRVQVDSAVRKASLSLPAKDRDNFVNAMRSVLNYNAIEKISVDAMVRTYTLVELTSMEEYYSKPEAITATKKTLFWASEVQPEIVRMIDKAMMRIRTGQ
ncbi:MAG: hypothetical protein ACRBDL_01865 [Alphaproteobacteria bacterium]